MARIYVVLNVIAIENLLLSDSGRSDSCVEDYFFIVNEKGQGYKVNCRCFKDFIYF